MVFLPRPNKTSSSVGTMLLPFEVVLLLGILAGFDESLGSGVTFVVEPSEPPMLIPLAESMATRGIGSMSVVLVVTWMEPSKALLDTLGSLASIP